MAAVSNEKEKRIMRKSESQAQPSLMPCVSVESYACLCVGDGRVGPRGCWEEKTDGEACVSHARLEEIHIPPSLFCFPSSTPCAQRRYTPTARFTNPGKPITSRCAGNVLSGSRIQRPQRRSTNTIFFCYFF